MDEQENNKETLKNLESDMDIDEQELIDMECPTDSEEPLEVAIEYDLKI
jgi:hypothetical protein|tara:strand:+ start:161 stop:307 length:147 start_codon:yes stop_codon:yes gene_type:complete